MSCQNRRKPLSIVLRFLFEDDPDIEAEVIAPAQGDFPRKAVGLLYRKGEACGDFSVDLSADFFEESNRRGRPRKDERNIAVSCAVLVAQHKNGKIGVIAARNNVVDQWKSSGYTGLKAEKHVRDRTNDAKEILADAPIRIVKFFETGPALVLIFERGSKFAFGAGVIAVKGRGWWWIEGQEAATHAEFTTMKFEVPTDSDQNTFFIDELRSATAGREMKDFVMYP